MAVQGLWEQQTDWKIKVAISWKVDGHSPSGQKGHAGDCLLSCCLGAVRSGTGTQALAEACLRHSAGWEDAGGPSPALCDDHVGRHSLLSRLGNGLQGCLRSPKELTGFPRYPVRGVFSPAHAGGALCCLLSLNCQLPFVPRKPDVLTSAGRLGRWGSYRVPIAIETLSSLQAKRSSRDMDLSEWMSGKATMKSENVGTYSIPGRGHKEWTRDCISL